MPQLITATTAGSVELSVVMQGVLILARCLSVTSSVALDSVCCRHSCVMVYQTVRMDLMRVESCVLHQVSAWALYSTCRCLGIRCGA